ncbi:MAG: TIM-barrel domain-containing protein [Phycisphaerales bacterium]
MKRTTAVIRTLLPFIASWALVLPSLAQPVGELIGEAIVRFHQDKASAAAALPSFALSVNPPVLGDTPGGFAVRPAFSQTGDGRHAVSISIESGTSLYGTGEVFGPLLRNGRKTVCWNTDAFGYGEKNPSLYQSHPWVLALRADGTSFGVLADTTWRCEIDLTDGIRFTADGPAFPVIVIDRASPQAVLTALSRLTGTMDMPPLWALGYHQCRYSYEPEARVREIAQGFRSRRIPCDVIWMDIDYMDEYRVFSFSQSRFPDPARLNADLHKQGFHTVWMIDPGVQARPGYNIFDSGSAGDHWVLASDRTPYRGEVWPGYCVFPDFTRPQTQQWWAGLYTDFMSRGIDGVWNDMNEPAVFNVESKTMPEDNIHRGGMSLPGGDVSEGPHARFHNVYGMLMAKWTRQGVIAANPDKRPFVLTRAGYLGSHRYAATWTGDNSAEWDDLEASIPMVLNLGLSGQPFCGPDIGGFNGNGDGRLFARWMGIGAMLPFARGHTGKGNIDKEPWAFGADVENTCTIALKRRYRLLPYFYTLFHHASRDGLPIARPLFFADPKDPALRSEDDAFLIGDDLMVVAKVTPLRDRLVALPTGRDGRPGSDWAPVSLIEGDTADPDLPEIRVRRGRIVPMGSDVQSTTEITNQTLTLLICLDDNGQAEGTVYVDQGDGLGYKDGRYVVISYTANRVKNAAIDEPQIAVRGEVLEGNLPVPRWELLLQVVK